ncbi:MULTISPECIES: hypothetical protein [Brevundimonas]|nr:MULTISPECIES: hypothetical protein [Brevundimonas]
MSAELAGKTGQGEGDEEGSQQRPHVRSWRAFHFEVKEIEQDYG